MEKENIIGPMGRMLNGSVEKAGLLPVREPVLVAGVWKCGGFLCPCILRSGGENTVNAS